MSGRELIGDHAPSPSEIATALEDEFAVAAVERHERERVYYDTFDALLRENGVSLVHEDGRLELVERDGGGRDCALAWATAPTDPVLGIALPPGPLRDELVSVIETRALLPLVRVHERSEAVRILDELEKTVARVNVVSPEVVSSAGLRTALRARVRLDPVRGYEDALARTEAMLIDALALSPPPLALVDEAVLASGGLPEGRSAKVEIPIGPADRADVAAVRVLRRLLEVMDDTIAGTIADIDSEFLHDYRVAIRRTRSVQRELAGVFEPGALARMRTEFRWLQLATGDARDLDVYVLGFDGLQALLPDYLRADLEPLRSVLRGRRLVARREMNQALRSDRAVRLRRDWEAVLGSLVESPDGDRPDARRPIGEIASRRIRKVYGRMLQMGGEIDADSPPERYHELRKRGKELRYLLELFGLPLHDELVVKPMIRALKGLQDVLGRHQDREVQIGAVRSLADEVSALPGGPAALMAMGVLIERLESDAAAARGQFAASFAVFSGAEQRRLVRGTFA